MAPEFPCYNDAMKAFELTALRDLAHQALRELNRPLPTTEIARHLFGPARHDLPETQVVVRALLGEDPRFIETHDTSWTVRNAPAVHRRLDEITYAVVDLETTGSVIGVDEIIEIGLVLLRGDVEVQRYSSLVWTDCTIPPWVARLTGIRKKTLSHAPPFAEIAPRLHELIDGAVFVAHDIRFDLPFLRWEFERRELEPPEVTGLCTLQLSQRLWPDLGGWSLAGLAQHFGIGHERPHRAPADAAAAAGLLRRSLARAAELGLTRLEDLFFLDDGRAGEDEVSARAAES
jgi:DNA polymerase III epsilon subunit family exonuclease